MHLSHTTTVMASTSKELDKLQELFTSTMSSLEGQTTAEVLEDEVAATMSHYDELDKMHSQEAMVSNREEEQGTGQHLSGLQTFGQAGDLRA